MILIFFDYTEKIYFVIGTNEVTKLRLSGYFHTFLIKHNIIFSVSFQKNNYQFKLYDFD